MNVVPFPKPVQDEKLVELLEDMLDKAKRGEIRSFVGVAFDVDTHYGQRIAHNAHNMQAIGAAQLLLSWLIHNWEKAPSLPDPVDPGA